ncbi:MAG: hypothetical protein COV48_12800 [Elusimicrobia bacterium CG11_big_fil_rev_8_21_14_0_20_64_6]|nr:MAG: hypothetical protein COV48_12800 [Elusimicrobia bacterium CG11_big_fil_rev_8_21_14_0_20_64_6]
MPHDLTIAQYLRSRSPISPARLPIVPAAFVTISREAGAGAHSLADALVARLSKEKDPRLAGWHIFDREITERVAKDPGLQVSLKSLLNEEFHEGLEDYFRSAFSSKGSQLKIDHHIFRTVRSICALGKAIIIGRAGALVTRDLPRGVHVRLVSEREIRVERIVSDTGVTSAEARKNLDLKDAQRAHMVKADFGKDIVEPLLYDCVWNTATVSSEEIAETLTGLILRRSD